MAIVHGLTIADSPDAICITTKLTSRSLALFFLTLHNLTRAATW